MKFRIQPSSIGGQVVVPPSKSHTLRGLLFALMAKGKSVIENYLSSPDTIAMIEAIRQFGAQVSVYEDRLEVEGVNSQLREPTDVIQAGNSGIVLRFISGIASLVDRYVIITGDESIRSRRPIKPLLDALTSQNVFAEAANKNGHAPVIIRGPMKPGVMAIEGADSQPVSALLITTAFLHGPSEVYVMNPGEKPWIDVTLDWLRWLGVEITNHDYRHFKIMGRASYQGFNISIPGDFSTAAYAMVAAVISGQSVRVFGLNMDDSQSDKNLTQVLEQVGAKVEYFPNEYAIEVTGVGEIKGIEVDVNNCIDMAPLLAVLGCFASSPMEIRGARIARFKESDRISAITTELKKMGADIEELEDGMYIRPSKLKGAHLDSHCDHRIALSLVVAAFGAEGESELEGIECISKTYPTFLCDFCLLGGKIL